MAGLADLLGGDGSIETLEAAAPWRLRDGRSLEDARRFGAAVYVYGYVAEIRLTASCYRLLNIPSGRTISRSDRDEVLREARTLRLMSAEPHDLAGWGRYLAYVRKRDRGGYPRHFHNELVDRTADLYDNWRPRPRYRSVTPNAAQLKVVRDAVTWLDQVYVRLWE